MKTKVPNPFSDQIDMFKISRYLMGLCAKKKKKKKETTTQNKYKCTVNKILSPLCTKYLKIGRHVIKINLIIIITSRLSFLILFTLTARQLYCLLCFPQESAAPNLKDSKQFWLSEYINLVTTYISRLKVYGCHTLASLWLNNLNILLSMLLQYSFLKRCAKAGISI